MDVDAWVQSFLHTMGAIFDDKVRLNFEDRATCAVNNALKILSGRELSLQTDDPKCFCFLEHLYFRNRFPFRFSHVPYS